MPALVILLQSTSHTHISLSLYLTPYSSPIHVSTQRSHHEVKQYTDYTQDAKYNLKLYQFISTYVCDDVTITNHCNINKVQQTKIVHTFPTSTKRATRPAHHRRQYLNHSTKHKFPLDFKFSLFS
jgi:hypothetical protein